MRPVIFSVGHSTHPLAAFLALLTAHGVEMVVDVRRFPASQRFPHFNAAHLAAALQTASMGYTHLPVLGGRRRPRPDSSNTAWRHPAFRGYADYLATPEFARGLAALLDVAAGARVALMCAEAVWWRCHRRLIADLLVARGHEVVHLLRPHEARHHRLSDVAEARGGTLYLCGELVA